MARYYQQLAGAFCRGRLAIEVDDAAAIDAGRAAGLKLHKFKRDVRPLPRVSRVLGQLSGLQPTSLLDVGSGRGAFLWPLLDQQPSIAVTAIDALAHRARDLDAVRRGGVARLDAARMSVCELAFAGDSFDGVTILEVLEHLQDPARAAAELLRVARRFVIASVPSKPDDNPEHIQLFTRDTLTALFVDAGARRVRCDYVLNHIVAFVSLEG